MNIFRWGKTAGGAGGGAAPPPGNPLELITYDTDTGQFNLGKEALKVLRGVKGPVGVVAVSGRARQGKSFILNQLLGQSSGFTVASTHRPCTKGLWMWSTPVERQSSDGSKYHLVLLDTEGIDAYDQTGQYSTQIFSLAVLLSSLFVYNQMGGIDEAALDRLSLVTEMTRHIRVKAGSASGESELADFTPSFLWLLRDFYLTLEEEGRKITPREYLETALSHLNGSGPSVDAKNQIRESIKALFPNRDCFSLVRPHNDERQLAQLESLPPGQLRPEFRDGLDKLTRLIFARAQPKRLGTQIISGNMLASLATAYVDAINHGAVPTIATAWQGVAEAECRRAADVAEAAYTRAFNDSVEPEEAVLDAEHLRCMGIAHQAYADVAVGDEGIRKANEARFTDRLASGYASKRKERLASAEVLCRKQISEFTNRLHQLGAQSSTTRESLQRELASFEQEYTSAPTGGAVKWQLLQELRRLFDGIVTQIDEKRERERQQQQQSQAAAAAAEQKLRAAESEGASLQRQLNDAQSQLAKLQRTLDSERAGHSREIDELQRQIKDTGGSHQSSLSGLQRERDAAQARAEAAEAHYAQRESSLQGQVTQLQSQVASLQAKVTAAQESSPINGTGTSDAGADGGYGTPDEGADVNAKAMTIAQCKDWLTEHGHEDTAYELSNKRAKKSEYVAAIEDVQGISRV